MQFGRYQWMFSWLGFRLSAQLSVKSSFNIMRYCDILRYITSVIKLKYRDTIISMSYPCFFWKQAAAPARGSSANIQAAMAMINTKSSEMLKWQFVVLSAKHSKMMLVLWSWKIFEIEPKAKQEPHQQRCWTTNGWESDTNRIVSIICLEGPTNYEEKIGTLESSALLYFSKVSSSSVWWKLGELPSTSGFCHKVFSRVGGWRWKRSCTWL